MCDRINPAASHVKYGVLWRSYTDLDEPGTQYRLYSEWYDRLTDALAELECVAGNPRCADAKVYMRTVGYTELTGNAVEWLKENGG